MTSTVSQTSTTQTVSFMNIGTQLRLRPFVEPHGMIRMEIHPERSTGQLDSSGIPQTYTNQVTTNMIVPDGATIMIGGMIDTEAEKDWQGLPFLSRIPVLGYLFRPLGKHPDEERIGCAYHAAYLESEVSAGAQLSWPTAYGKPGAPRATATTVPPVPGRRKRL